MKLNNLYLCLVNLNALFITLSVSVFNEYINAKLAALIFIIAHFALYLIAPYKSQYGDSVLNILVQSRTAQLILVAIGIPFLLVAFYAIHLVFSAN